MVFVYDYTTIMICTIPIVFSLPLYRSIMNKLAPFQSQSRSALIRHKYKHPTTKNNASAAPSPLYTSCKQPTISKLACTNSCRLGSSTVYIRSGFWGSMSFISSGFILFRVFIAPYSVAAYFLSKYTPLQLDQLRPHRRTETPEQFCFPAIVHCPTALAHVLTVRLCRPHILSGSQHRTEIMDREHVQH